MTIVENNNQNNVIESGINVEDIEHLLDLMGGQLYKDEYSFINEIIQNSRDTTITQHGSCVDYPVKIKIDSDQNGYFVTFQDFGEGISLDRMNKILSKFGASTKRGTNSIGSKGVGYYSILRYTDKCFINTVSASVEYSYIFNKTDKGKFYLIDQKPTNEINGTTIKIYLNDVYEFKKQLRNKAVYWDCVEYVDIVEPLIKHETFTYSPDFTGDTKLHIQLNGYYYPFPYQELNLPVIHIPVALNLSKCNTTPSREEIVLDINSKAELIKLYGEFKDYCKILIPLKLNVKDYLNDYNDFSFKFLGNYYNISEIYKIQEYKDLVRITGYNSKVPNKVYLDYCFKYERDKFSKYHSYNNESNIIILDKKITAKTKLYLKNNYNLSKVLFVYKFDYKFILSLFPDNYKVNLKEFIKVVQDNFIVEKLSKLVLTDKYKEAKLPTRVISTEPLVYRFSKQRNIVTIRYSYTLDKFITVPNDYVDLRKLIYLGKEFNFEVVKGKSLDLSLLDTLTFKGLSITDYYYSNHISDSWDKHSYLTELLIHTDKQCKDNFVKFNDLKNEYLKKLNSVGSGFYGLSGFSDVLLNKVVLDNNVEKILNDIKYDWVDIVSESMRSYKYQKEKQNSLINLLNI